MSERYSRIFSLSENLYAEGSPVLIKAGALLRDNDTSWLIAQLKLRNISNKVIKLVKVEITCFDSMQRPIDEAILYEYLDLNITRDVDFGTQNAIKVSNTSTRSYSVRVVEVGFADNTVWNGSDNIWEPTVEQCSIKSVITDEESLEGYKNTFGSNAVFSVCEHKDLWFCTCGATNKSNESHCYKCNADLANLKNLDIGALKSEGIYTAACKMAESTDIDTLQNAIKEFGKIKDYRDSQSFVEKCDAKIVELQNADKAKNAKRNKTIKILSFVTAGLLLLGFLGYFIIYPFVSCWFGNYHVYINMYNVEEFEIPDGKTSIRDYAFYNCSNLTSVTIPDSVTSIGDSAFYNCSNLTSVTIGDSVTTIGGWAFSSCESLTSVTIGDSVTTIGDYAFSYCESLTSVTIPDSVTSIGDYAFEDCSSLTSVTIGDSVTSIGGRAFMGCVSLTSITIGDSVTTIGEWAFACCVSLTSVTIPDRVTSIGEWAFEDCSSLTSVTIGDSVTTIGEFAIAYCPNLASITFEGTVAQWNAITKGFGCMSNISATEVICSDGVVKLK